MESALLRKRQNVVIRLGFEVGHRCHNTRMSTSLSGRALSFDWRLWVRSSNGHDMSPFIDKVVFNLHPSSVYTYPTLIRPLPPYEIEESSFTSINVSVDIYIKTCSGSIKKRDVTYNVYFKNNKQRMAYTKQVYHDFVNPSDELRRCLLMCGGKEVATSGVLSPPMRPLMPLMLNKHNILQNISHSNKQKSWMFVQPIDNLPDLHKPMNKQPVIWNNDNKMKTQIISKTPHVDFRQVLKDVSMTDSETELLTKLYLSQSCYEKQSDANIVLPPMTDPIYQLPEFPISNVNVKSQDI